MIVCVCNAIREDEIRAAVRNGAPCAVTAYRSVDCEPQCGHCLPYAREIIEQERARLITVDSQAA
jgi:bacterioferritin-associated ferredoxin